MGTEVDLAVRQSFQLCRALQLPVLAAGLDIAAGQASAPVAFVQDAVDTEGQLQLRPLQIEGEFLVFDIALPTGGQGAEEVSPTWIPLPLRSMFARCALSRVASRFRLCSRLSANAS